MDNIVYILHGLGADSHANWFPWLKQELKSKGYTVAVPDFPSSAVPKLDEWLNALKSTIGQYGNGVLVGHSLGGLLAIQYLLQGGQSPKVILAATPFNKLAVAPELDEFFPLHKELALAKPASEFVIIQSDNDPLVLSGDAELWSRALGGKLVMLPGLGHLTIPEFPEILEYL